MRDLVSATKVAILNTGNQVCYTRFFSDLVKKSWAGWVESYPRPVFTPTQNQPCSTLAILNGNETYTF